MTLKGFRLSPGLCVGACVLLLAGGVLFGANWWVRPILDGQAAVEAGDLEAALLRYTAAGQRFDRFPVARRVAPGVYDLVLANQLSLLYTLQRFDAVIDRSGASDTDGAAAPFWAGCALFAKGAMEAKPEARLGWLAQSQEEFRRALERAPDDWDAKVDYELAGRLIAVLRKQPKATKQEMMQLLRQPPSAPKGPVKQVG